MCGPLAWWPAQPGHDELGVCHSGDWGFSAKHRNWPKWCLHGELSSTLSATNSGIRNNIWIFHIFHWVQCRLQSSNLQSECGNPSTSVWAVFQHRHSGPDLSENSLPFLSRILFWICFPFGQTHSHTCKSALNQLAILQMDTQYAGSLNHSQLKASL